MSGITVDLKAETKVIFTPGGGIQISGSPGSLHNLTQNILIALRDRGSLKSFQKTNIDRAIDMVHGIFQEHK